MLSRRILCTVPSAYYESDISVAAKKAGKITGTGLATNQAISSGGTLAVSIPVVFSQSGGKGGFSLYLSVPALTGIDYVSASVHRATTASRRLPETPC